MTVWARLHRQGDEWAEFLGVMLVVVIVVSVTALIGVGHVGLGAHDAVTQEAVRNVGGVAAGALLLLGLAMLFGIQGDCCTDG